MTDDVIQLAAYSEAVDQEVSDARELISSKFIKDGQYNSKAVAKYFDECQTRRQVQYHRPDTITALILTNAHLTRAAELVGRHRNGFRTHILSDEALATFYHDLEQAKLDDVKEGVYAEAAEGNMAAAKFLLERRNKEEFSSRVEHVGKDSGPVNVSVSPREELMALIFGSEGGKKDA